MCIHTYLCSYIYELSIQAPDQVDGGGGGGGGPEEVGGGEGPEEAGVQF